MLSSVVLAKSRSEKAIFHFPFWFWLFLDMADATSVIPPSVLRNLSDKLYEKRKNAALEVSFSEFPKIWLLGFSIECSIVWFWSDWILWLLLYVAWGDCEAACNHRGSWQDICSDQSVDGRLHVISSGESPQGWLIKFGSSFNLS